MTHRSRLNVTKQIIPFINTRPIWDLGAFFCLIPIWWAMGVGQLIWPLGLSWILLKVLKGEEEFQATRTLRVMALFLIIHMLSGLFIFEPLRLITFARSFFTYLSACLLLIDISFILKTREQLHFLMRSVTLSFGVTVFLGFMAGIGVFRPEFTSLLGHFLPNFVAYSDYGSRIAEKVLGVRGWFVIVNSFFRVRSVFLYSNMFGIVIAVSIPFLIYQLRICRDLGFKLLVVGVLLLAIFCLASTTSRIAFLGLFSGGLFYFVWVSGLRRLPNLLSLSIVAFSIAIIVIILLFGQDELLGSMVDFVKQLSVARGEGSLSGRLFVYQHTLAQWLKRPFLGWGTERDIVGFAFPAGSHSYYLGILYKHGIVGLAVFIMGAVTIWRDTNPNKLLIESKQIFRHEHLLLGYGRWVLIVLAIVSLTEVLDLDMMAFMFVWFYLSVLLIVNTSSYRSNCEEKCTK